MINQNSQHVFEYELIDPELFVFSCLTLLLQITTVHATVSFIIISEHSQNRQKPDWEEIFSDLMLNRNNNHVFQNDGQLET